MWDSLRIRFLQHLLAETEVRIDSRIASLARANAQRTLGSCRMVTSRNPNCLRVSCRPGNPKTSSLGHVLAMVLATTVNVYQISMAITYFMGQIGPQECEAALARRLTWRLMWRLIGGLPSWRRGSCGIQTSCAKNPLRRSAGGPSPSCGCGSQRAPAANIGWVSPWSATGLSRQRWSFCWSFVAENNENPMRFVWTAEPEKLLTAVRRGKGALVSIH